ncbi:MAG: Uma2 family endonuclease [Thermomicrobiales bacterium]
MSITTQLLTYRDLEQFPDDGMRYEIIDGVLYMSPAPLEIHQWSSGELYAVLRQAVIETGWGWVYYAPVDVRFAEDSQVQPDLLVIRRDRLHIYQGNTVHGAPDLVVEIISPSNPSYDQVAKRRLYEAGGVLEYWLVDPGARTFHILALRHGAYVPVDPIAGVFLSTVVPGLTIDPVAIFAARD